MDAYLQGRKIPAVQGDDRPSLKLSNSFESFGGWGWKKKQNRLKWNCGTRGPPVPSSPPRLKRIRSRNMRIGTCVCSAAP